MSHHLPQKVLHSKGGSHKDTLLCTPLLWDTPCRHLAGARLGLGMPRLCAGQEVPEIGGTAPPLVTRGGLGTLRPLHCLYWLCRWLCLAQRRQVALKSFHLGGQPVTLLGDVRQPRLGVPPVLVGPGQTGLEVAVGNPRAERACLPRPRPLLVHPLLHIEVGEQCMLFFVGSVHQLEVCKGDNVDAESEIHFAMTGIAPPERPTTLWHLVNTVPAWRSPKCAKTGACSITCPCECKVCLLVCLLCLLANWTKFT